jgi:RNA polymerase sigma-70 factor (sigma-E family)
MRHASAVTAFSEFVEARSASLFRTAYLMVGDHQLAQDLLQEALVKTLIAWPRLSDHQNVEAYTRRIVATTSI